MTELQAEADRVKTIIIGIGMNVNQKTDDFPENIRSIATSLSIEKGEYISRPAVIRAVLSNIEKLYLLYLEKGFYPIKLMWKATPLVSVKRLSPEHCQAIFLDEL